MTYLEKKEKEKYLLTLIKEKRLICTAQTAEKLDCSKRTIERMIANLRVEGYPIKYSRSKGCYYLSNEYV